MKVLAFFLDPWAKYGSFVSGLQRRFLELSSHLDSLGCEVYALEFESSNLGSWGYSDVRVFQVNRRFQDHRLLEMLVLTVQSLAICLRFKFDMIYAPCREVGRGMYVIPSFVVSFFCRKPLVIVFHHLHSWDFNESNLFKRMAYFHAKACIAVSSSTADDVRRHFRVGNVVVTGNGVDTGLFRTTASQPKVHDCVYFGRISRSKGLLTLLDAWKIVVKEIPSAKLLLMGSVLKRDERYFNKVILGLGLDHNVEFAGFLSDREVVRMLNSSKVFVSPSIEEGFGLTVVEAMAVGLPCVLSDLPAFRENFESVAVFYKLGDAGELAGSILDLLGSPERCVELGERGRDLVKCFSWRSVAEKELEVFRSVTEH